MFESNMKLVQPEEYDVYTRLIEYLVGNGWEIICGCPPAGTDNRFRKCLLPRRDLLGSQKGPRDEVDITAHNGKTILLIECKATLLDSMTKLNSLQESDYAKLMRIKTFFKSSELARLLQLGMGVSVPQQAKIELALAVERVNTPIPDNIVVFEVTKSSVTTHSNNSTLPFQCF